ncbi:hypothetical protein L1049_011775 [Liquidambar formosana]|uniref:Uncharacterized protein n=1 Tax=Liquidambar formosana TaxID=63359 RepID=A0AAP0RSK3_LIQFO
MVSSSHDLPQKSLQIKQDDKFFTRLLSKETSMANPSFRVYYGGASGAIPFLWESSPGTPKHTFSETSLPPLTPPPSYHFNSKVKSMQKHSKFKPNLLNTIFTRQAPKKTHVSPFPSSSSTTSSSSRSFSSSYSSSSTSMNPNFHGRCLQYELDNEEEAFESPTSTSCFGARHENSNGFRGCFQWWRA